MFKFFIVCFSFFAINGSMSHAAGLNKEEKQYYEEITKTAKNIHEVIENIHTANQKMATGIIHVTSFFTFAGYVALSSLWNTKNSYLENNQEEFGFYENNKEMFQIGSSIFAGSYLMTYAYDAKVKKHQNLCLLKIDTNMTNAILKKLTEDQKERFEYDLETISLALKNNTIECETWAEQFLNFCERIVRRR